MEADSTSSSLDSSRNRNINSNPNLNIHNPNVRNPKKRPVDLVYDELIDRQAKIDSLQNGRLKMIREKTKLQVEKRNVEQKYEALNREKGVLETERNELRDELREVRDQNIRLSVQNEMLSAEVDRMRAIERDYTRMFNENVSLRTAYQRLLKLAEQPEQPRLVWSDFRVSVYDIWELEIDLVTNLLLRVHRLSLPSFGHQSSTTDSQLPFATVWPISPWKPVAISM